MINSNIYQDGKNYILFHYLLTIEGIGTYLRQIYIPINCYKLKILLNINNITIITDVIIQFRTKMR